MAVGRVFHSRPIWRPKKRSVLPPPSDWSTQYSHFSGIQAALQAQSQRRSLLMASGLCSTLKPNTFFTSGTDKRQLAVPTLAPTTSYTSLIFSRFKIKQIWLIRAKDSLTETVVEREEETARSCLSSRRAPSMLNFVANILASHCLTNSSTTRFKYVT